MIEESSDPIDTHSTALFRNRLGSARLAFPVFFLIFSIFTVHGYDQLVTTFALLQYMAL